MGRVVYTLDDAKEAVGDRRSVCCIGVFDGVHLGHRRLVEATVAEARSAERLSVVLTFSNHPLSVLAPAYAPRLITDAREKANRLRELGPSLVVMVPFERKLADLSPDRFVKEILLGRLGVASLWCGGDFRFGRGGSGTIAVLEELGRRWGFETHTLESVVHRDRTVSSTWIRSLIDQGRVEAAAECLGREHIIRGRVRKGDGRGRRIGFPTANIKPPDGIILPADGAYAVRVEIGRETFGGMAHIGPSPTFGVAEKRIEVHLFDFSGNLRGKTIGVRFAARLREPKRFDSPEALAARLCADEKRARKILGIADT